MTDRTGQCMCGAVRFSARDVPDTFGACHCEMCQRWTGSALLGVSVPEGNVTWTGSDHITRVRSSAWAERGFCSKCGSGLFFRITVEGEYSGNIELPIGVFHDASGMTLSNEIYIDHKPDSFSYAANDRQVLTRAQCVAKFPPLEGEANRFTDYGPPKTPQVPREVTHLREDSDLRITYYPGQSDTVVVTFNSVSYGLYDAQPDEFIGTAKGADINHVISVTDRQRSWFSAPGMVDRIVDTVALKLAELSPKRIATLGSSMGGHGALLFAERLGVDVALAFSPQFSMQERMKETRWTDLRPFMTEHRLSALGPHLTGKTRAICLFGAQTRQDRRHMMWILRRCVADCYLLDDAHHIVAEKIKTDGQLGDVFAAALAGDDSTLSAILGTPQPRPDQEGRAS